MSELYAFFEVFLFVASFVHSFSKHSAHLVLSAHQNPSPTGVSPWIARLAAKIAQAHLIYRRMEALGAFMRPKGDIRAGDGTLRLMPNKVYFDLFQHTRMVIIKHTENKCWRISGSYWWSGSRLCGKETIFMMIPLSFHGKG